MYDEVLTRNSDGDLEVRVVQASGDSSSNKDDVFTRDNDGRLALRVTGTGGGGDDVSSVNGKTGNVVLTGADINATINTATPTGAEATTKTITQHLQTLNDYNMTLQGEVDTNAGKTAELDADLQGKVDKNQGAANAGKILKIGTDGNIELGDDAGDSLPTQTGHNGVLQTNGTALSWNDNIKVNSTSILLTNTAQPAVTGQIVIGNGAGGPGNSGVDNVIIGDRATAANYGIAIGADAKAAAESSVQIGAGTNSEAGTVCVATGTYPNQKNVKLLNNQGFIPANALADGGTEGQVLSITPTGLAWTSGAGGSGTDNNGLEGDYATTYGIVDETTSGLPYIKAVGSKVVVIPAGLVLDVPGQSGLTTVASAIEYEVVSTDNPTLFLAQGTVIEATNVFFQVEAPEDGTTGYAAWWNGTMWQFKSNDTGNVWRPANAVRIAKTVFTDGSLTRLCFTGCRVLNKQDLRPSFQPLPKETYGYPMIVATPKGVSGGPNSPTTGIRLIDANKTESTALASEDAVPSTKRVATYFASKANDFNTPITTTNKGATMSDVDRAATSGTLVGSYWFGKTNASATVPAPTLPGQNYYDFTTGQVYKSTDGTTWTLDTTYTPPTDIDVQIGITSKFWDIPEQENQHGGVAKWSHTDSDWAYYPAIYSDAVLESKADIDLDNVLPNIDFVVESQLPTAENNYTWYRKYKSGWIEQGGVIPVSADNVLVTFPIEMANAEYPVYSGFADKSGAAGWRYANRTTTGFTKNLIGSTTCGGVYKIEGMAAV